jgi:hypothetical protein
MSDCDVVSPTDVRENENPLKAVDGWCMHIDIHVDEQSL